MTTNIWSFLWYDQKKSLTLQLANDDWVVDNSRDVMCYDDLYLSYLPIALAATALFVGGGA